MKAETLFLEAIELDDQVQQLSYIRDAGVEDEVKREALVLLEAHRKPDEFLENPVGGERTVSTMLGADGHGTMIGRYKLLQQIGEGGFGAVYMAERTGEIQQKVAVKLIKPGMDSKEVLARFEAERQALAMMEHPNIARVIDAGTTDSGRPFFVMELVKGLPITEYCDRHKMSTKERLELFQDVCSGIQHAHQKGIIHRDIKPSNILVTNIDGRAVPKVIDFGVAKALNQRLTEKTLFTRFGNMIGTPQYMSPEQAELSTLDVDTRSDVYSLGVLLYELLTGTTPVEKEKLLKAAFDELRRLIREEEAVLPSERVSTLGDRASEIADKRETAPSSLRQTLRGDLDWIVLKSLDKDRSRRYESPSQLGEDIERFLTTKPISARKPSLLYSTSKLLKRNAQPLRYAIFAAACILACGIGAHFIGDGSSRDLYALTTHLNRGDEAFDTREFVQAERSYASAESMLIEQLPDSAQQLLRVSNRLAMIRSVLMKDPSAADALQKVIETLEDFDVPPKVIKRFNRTLVDTLYLSCVNACADDDPQDRATLFRLNSEVKGEEWMLFEVVSLLDRDQIDGAISTLQQLGDAGSLEQVGPHGLGEMIATLCLLRTGHEGEASMMFSLANERFIHCNWMLDQSQPPIWKTYYHQLDKIRKRIAREGNLSLEQRDYLTKPHDERQAIWRALSELVPNSLEVKRQYAYEEYLAGNFASAISTYTSADDLAEDGSVMHAGVTALTSGDLTTFKKSSSIANNRLNLESKDVYSTSRYIVQICLDREANVSSEIFEKAKMSHNQVRQPITSLAASLSAYRRAEYGQAIMRAQQGRYHGIHAGRHAIVAMSQDKTNQNELALKTFELAIEDYKETLKMLRDTPRPTDGRLQPKWIDMELSRILLDEAAELLGQPNPQLERLTLGKELE